MTGQVCMSVERVYVETPAADAFTRKLVAEMSRLRTGENGARAEIDYGPFTSPRQVEIVERHLADAVAKGARVLCGGKRLERPNGIFFEPTVLAGVDHSMAIMTEETFGPVVPVMPVANAEEATSKLKEIDKVKNEIVLENGLRIRIGAANLSGIAPGDNIKVEYIVGDEGPEASTVTKL